MWINSIYLAVILLCLLVTTLSGSRVNCHDKERIREDHIHLCCKHPDGHNVITETCAKQTKFNLPSSKEEAPEDLAAGDVMNGTCWAKCVFDNYKFLNHDALDMQVVRNHYKTFHQLDPEYESEMIAAFDQCHSKAEKAISDFLSTRVLSYTIGKIHNCKPMAAIILSCVIFHFFHSCPRSRWSNTTECMETLDFAKKCKRVLQTM
ncbi:uncharacterized protein LOC108594898 [Drosophila busckii]|uniref:uncharacterized protein LOC108594898 n=1 Tax=Drosophila busckii TaxID=30019 RepID=UPI001432FEB2|nr:uncharacterized protein LOC108594898 [Drosophila busckii]